MAARAGDGAAWNDLGVVYGKQGRRQEAFDAYTMGARYGDPTARGNLARMGWPLPAADLAPMPAAQSAGDNIEAILRGAADGYGRGPRPVTLGPDVTSPSSSTCTARPTAVAPGTQGPVIVDCR